MRHRKKFNHLGRKAGHRRALLANMASSLILHKRIKTTTAKAKALRVYVEPLITKTKGLSTIEEKTHAQRVVFGHLQDKHAVKELFGDIASKVESRPGGYTRILKLGNRPGDNADMSMIELVDYNENMLTTKDSKKSTTRRSRRGGKKKTDSTSQPQATADQEQTTGSTEAAPTEPEDQAQIADAEIVETPEKEADVTEQETQSAETESDEPKEDEVKSSGAEDQEQDDAEKPENPDENKEDKS